jgi:hypothetical protein
MSAALRLPRFCLSRDAVAAGIAGGTAWGVLTAAGFLGLSAWDCGGVCLGEALHTLGACVGTGLLAMGPVCAYLRCRR